MDSEGYSVSCSDSSSSSVSPESSSLAADRMVRIEMEAAEALADLADFALRENGNCDSSGKWGSKGKRGKKRVCSESSLDDSALNPVVDLVPSCSDLAPMWKRILGEQCSLKHPSVAEDACRMVAHQKIQELEAQLRSRVQEVRDREAAENALKWDIFDLQGRLDSAEDARRSQLNEIQSLGTQMRNVEVPLLQRITGLEEELNAERRSFATSAELQVANTRNELMAKEVQDLKARQSRLEEEVMALKVATKAPSTLLQNRVQQMEEEVRLAHAYRDIAVEDRKMLVWNFVKAKRVLEAKLAKEKKLGDTRVAQFRTFFLRESKNIFQADWTAEREGRMVSIQAPPPDYDVRPRPGEFLIPQILPTPAPVPSVVAPKPGQVPPGVVPEP